MTDIDSTAQQSVPLILVVDDDRVMRTLLRTTLEEEGYRIIEAKDGEQCLVEYTRCQPDMVLLDAVMPEMDGFTCCQLLRNLPQSQYTPILMITALDDQDSVDQAFTAGATDYVTKPIYWAVLSQRVQRLLVASQALQEAEQIKEQVRKRREWEQLLRKMTQQLCHPLKLKQFLNNTVAEIQRLTQAERVLLYQEKNQIPCEAITPGYPSLKELGLQMLEWATPFQSQYQKGEVVVLDDLTQGELSEPAIAQLIQFKTTAALIAPLVIHEQVWGLLCVHQCQTPHPWETWEVEQLSTLTNLLAIAIYQFQLREKLMHSVS